MALIIEDGTGKATSQSYASEAELASYAAARGVTVTGTDTQLLIKAMDYVEQQTFKGTKNTDEQALQWPRYNVYIDTYCIESGSIPQLLKEAQMELALSIDGGLNPLTSEGRATKREKVDVIEVEYMDGARNVDYPTAFWNKIAKLLANGGGVSAVVMRA